MPSLAGQYGHRARYARPDAGSRSPPSHCDPGGPSRASDGFALRVRLAQHRRGADPSLRLPITDRRSTRQDRRSIIGVRQLPKPAGPERRGRRAERFDPHRARLEFGGSRRWGPLRRSSARSPRTWSWLCSVMNTSPARRRLIDVRRRNHAPAAATSTRTGGPSTIPSDAAHPPDSGPASPHDAAARRSRRSALRYCTIEPAPRCEDERIFVVGRSTGSSCSTTENGARRPMRESSATWPWSFHSRPCRNCDPG